MAIQKQLIEYTHGDTVLEGYMAWDDSISGTRPCVLIAHAWAGRDHFVEQKAEALAAQGYVGFALDMYGKGKRGYSVAENSALMTPLVQDRALLQTRMALGLAAARQQELVAADQVAAIGFCFGGLCALDLARTGADIKGVASFHGLLMPPGNTDGQAISAKVLLLHGYDDPMATPDALLAVHTELSNAGADWQTHCYGGVKHAFTNPEAHDTELGLIYNNRAADRAFKALDNFLAELF